MDSKRVASLYHISLFPLPRALIELPRSWNLCKLRLHMSHTMFSSVLIDWSKSLMQLKLLTPSKTRHRRPRNKKWWHATFLLFNLGRSHARTEAIAKLWRGRFYMRRNGKTRLSRAHLKKTQESSRNVNKMGLRQLPSIVKHSQPIIRKFHCLLTEARE